MAPAGSLLPLLKHAAAIVDGMSSSGSGDNAENALQQLKSVVFAITSTGRHDTDLTSEESSALWNLVVLLWVRSNPVKLAEVAVQTLLSLAPHCYASTSKQVCCCVFQSPMIGSNLFCAELVCRLSQQEGMQ